MSNLVASLNHPCTPQMLLPSGAAEPEASWSRRGPGALGPACNSQLSLCSAGKYVFVQVTALESSQKRLNLL